MTPESALLAWLKDARPKSGLAALPVRKRFKAADLNAKLRKRTRVVRGNVYIKTQEP